MKFHIVITLNNNFMLFFANKAKQEVNEIKEVKVIQIEALETVFNTETGEWETESMRQNDNLAKKLRIQIEVCR